MYVHVDSLDVCDTNQTRPDPKLQFNIAINMETILL